MALILRLTEGEDICLETRGTIVRILKREWILPYEIIFRPSGLSSFRLHLQSLNTAARPISVKTPETMRWKRKFYAALPAESLTANRRFQSVRSNRPWDFLLPELRLISCWCKVETKLVEEHNALLIRSSRLPDLSRAVFLQSLLPSIFMPWHFLLCCFSSLHSSWLRISARLLSVWLSGSLHVPWQRDLGCVERSEPMAMRQIGLLLVSCNWSIYQRTDRGWSWRCVTRGNTWQGSRWIVIGARMWCIYIDTRSVRVL